MIYGPSSPEMNEVGSTVRPPTFPDDTAVETVVTSELEDVDTTTTVMVTLM